MPSLYVAATGIGESIEERELEDAFGKFGRIEKIWVARKPPGFAFIDYGDQRDAEDAVDEMNGKDISGASLRVELRRDRRESSNIKPGDWPCPRCNAHNFARRTECFRCNEYKPRDMDDNRGGYDGGRDDRGGFRGRERRDSRDRRERYDSRDRGFRGDRGDSRDRRGDSRDRRGDSRDRRGDRGDSRDRGRDRRDSYDDRDRRREQRSRSRSGGR